MSSESVSLAPRAPSEGERLSTQDLARGLKSPRPDLSHRVAAAWAEMMPKPRSADLFEGEPGMFSALRLNPAEAASADVSPSNEAWHNVLLVCPSHVHTHCTVSIHSLLFAGAGGPVSWSVYAAHSEQQQRSGPREAWWFCDVGQTPAE